MSKIIVTDTLADALKMLRMQNGVKSKDLANHLGKTPGYISKLEKQEIKSIELDTLESIFSFILGDNYEKTEIWEQVYASLQVKYSKEELDKEIWFANFDTVYRNIPIPDTLIDFFNDRIVSLNITRELLLQRINANEALSDEEKNDERIKYNTWYPTTKPGSSLIKIYLEEKNFFDILDKRTLSSPYVFIYCILYYILKIEKHGSVVNIGEPQIIQISKEATAILNSHKFYSIAERESIVNQAQSKEEIHNLLSSFDNNNLELISKLLGKLKLASDIDIRVTNDRLAGLLKNLDTDVWFTLKIISLNYFSLEAVDIADRKEFLRDIDSLIQKYADKQKSIKNNETY